MEELSAALRSNLHGALLTMCASPRSEHVRLFNPNARGELKECSRQEALDRHLPMYTSTRLCTLSKVHPLQGGGWCCLRYTANGVSVGQARFRSKNNLPITESISIN